MGEILDSKLEDFQNALTSLESVLEREKSELVRDSTIKRFEYTFDSGWKTAKRYLKDELGIDERSPKKVIRELRKNGLINAEKAEKFLEMTDDRNKSVHSYNKEFIEGLYSDIKEEYFDLLKDLYKILLQRR
ncbi:MAG: HI0074 family nucleotidyltransferase substrate-binding subunit [Candidatus Magasanikbacteria bacterium]